MMAALALLAAVLLAGGRSTASKIAPPDSHTARILFQPDVHGSSWITHPDKLRWGLLLTTDELIILEEISGGLHRNHPVYSESEFLNKMATIKDVKNGTEADLEIEAGEYDGLILIDQDGDGVIDGYLGTSHEQVPLSKLSLGRGRVYLLKIDKREQVEFRELE